MCTGRHYVALMWHRWALACGTDEHRHKALMDTDRWHCWGYTDHQGTLIISALMTTVSVTAREERNADNQHFPVYM
ncbi:unnamed protein product [Staurois parvus]|uniref:Uncharacterized protein n=1 Tax=Staurois parvus TaxID=386267 RepID=A0ABN9DFC1_9NEOB|nr:unnamed protein product [Staurois parvus]